MIALDFAEPAKPIVEKLEAAGVLVLPSGPKTIRFLPPLVITREQLEVVIKEIKKVLA
jgi:acetylornithine aminotransferase